MALKLSISTPLRIPKRGVNWRSVALLTALYTLNGDVSQDYELEREVVCWESGTNESGTGMS